MGIEKFSVGILNMQWKLYCLETIESLDFLQKAPPQMQTLIIDSYYGCIQTP